MLVLATPPGCFRSRGGLIEYQFDLTGIYRRGTERRSRASDSLNPPSALPMAEGGFLSSFQEYDTPRRERPLLQNKRYRLTVSPAGRPEVGYPIHVRLGGQLFARVDRYARRQKISRAEAVRRLLTAGLEAT